jgi:hypothetical protein
MARRGCRGSPGTPFQHEVALPGLEMRPNVPKATLPIYMKTKVVGVPDGS